MEEEREMIKPILLKLGVVLGLSFAGGYLYKNHVRIRSLRLFRQRSTGVCVRVRFYIFFKNFFYLFIYFFGSLLIALDCGFRCKVCWWWRIWAQR